MNIKGINTVICSILFVIAGILSIGFNNDRASPNLFPGHASAYANELIVPNFTKPGLPLDLQLDLNKRTTVDTVFVAKTDTVYKTKYKTKIQKAAEPDVVETHDTLFVPIFYITTPLEYEVESTEIRVIDKVQIDSLLRTKQTDLFIINE